jgi:hypothetical protein
LPLLGLSEPDLSDKIDDPVVVDVREQLVGVDGVVSSNEF